MLQLASSLINRRKFKFDKNYIFKKETHNIIYKGTLVGCVGLLFPPYCNHDWGKDGVELGYWVGED